MRKSITILTAIAAALTSTIGMARDAEPVAKRFVHDGQTYVYTIADHGEYKVVQGNSYPAGRAFRLVVRGDQVSGRSGGVPVSFNIMQAIGASDVATTTR